MPAPIHSAPLHLLRAGATGLLLGALVLACSGPAPNESSTTPGPDAGTRIYHVQLQLTDDKDRAAAVLGRAEQWWQEYASSARPPIVEGTQSSDTPTDIFWKAPFYRVRLGPFATKEQAETVLEAARPTFSDAFVAPSRVENP